MTLSAETAVHGGKSMPDLIGLRKEFLETGVSSPAVRPVVLESWRRSREYGLRPQSLPRQVPGEADLARLRKENAEFLRGAQPFLDALHEDLKVKPHVLALSDRNGYILRLWRAGVSSRETEAANIFEGASWHERDIGSNGIGSCLAEGKPLVLIGPEHFQDAYVGWTCIGVPLRDSGNEIAGALDLSVPNEHVELPVWGMILDVARDIEAGLRKGSDSSGPKRFKAPGVLSSLYGVMELLVSQLDLPPTHGNMVASVRGAVADLLAERGRTVERLQSIETRYDLVNRATNDVIWDWNLETGELLWNEALQEIFGYSPDEIDLRIEWWHDHLHPDDRDRVIASIEGVIADSAKETWADEYRFLNSAGEWRSVLDRGVLRRAENGRGLRMIGSMLDITDRVRREEELHVAVQRFETLANMMPQFVWSTRPDGYHDYFNERWYEYTGMAREGDQGWNWKNYLHPDDLSRTLEIWRRSLDTGVPYEVHYRFKRASDGAYRWFIGRAMPIFDREGRITRWFGTCTDIEDQRRQEEKLEQLVAARTAELEEKTRRLRQLAADLGSAEQRERRRLAALLHDDLQQVLVAARMQVARVGRRVESESGQRLLGEAQDWIDQASDTARDLSRELRPPALYEGGLDDALKWLCSEMGKRHNLKVRLETSGGQATMADDTKALLFECVRELLFNASKYAHTPEVTVSLRKQANALRLVVSDSGRGFDVSTVAVSGGSSFGLFSIRERLAALGGEMIIESAPGKGTRVELKVLPAEPRVPANRRRTPSLVPAEPTHQSRAAITTEHRKRVLVVDDHMVVRQGISAILDGDKRVSVVGQAANGVEAIEAVERCHPDVILMDLNMPRMNGIEATREIRRRWPDVEIIGLSVQDDETTAEAMLNAGASSFLPKAGDAEGMIAAILRDKGTKGRSAAAKYCSN